MALPGVGGDLASSSSASTGPISFQPVTLIGAGSREGFDWQAFLRGSGGETAAANAASSNALGVSPLLIVVVLIVLVGALIYLKRG